MGGWVILDQARKRIMHESLGGWVGGWLGGRAGGWMSGGWWVVGGGGENSFAISIVRFTRKIHL